MKIIKNSFLITSLSLCLRCIVNTASVVDCSTKPSYFRPCNTVTDFKLNYGICYTLDVSYTTLTVNGIQMDRMRTGLPSGVSMFASSDPSGTETFINPAFRDETPNQGKVFHRPVYGARETQCISSSVRYGSPNQNDFTGTEAWVSTFYEWQYGDPNAKNTYQLTMITDGTKTFAFFAYAEMDNFPFKMRILTPPNRDNSLEVTAAIGSSSNIGIPGLFLYRIDMDLTNLDLEETHRSNACSGPPSAPPTGTLVTECLENAVYFYDCDDGYEYTGGDLPTLVCDATNQWPTAVPMCTLVSCGTPPSPPTGTVASGSDFTYGGVITYSCSTGFEYLPGTLPQLECLASGQWSRSVPVCTRVELSWPTIFLK